MMTIAMRMANEIAAKKGEGIVVILRNKRRRRRRGDSRGQGVVGRPLLRSRGLVVGGVLLRSRWEGRGIYVC